MLTARGDGEPKRRRSRQEGDRTEQAAEEEGKRGKKDQ